MKKKWILLAVCLLVLENVPACSQKEETHSEEKNMEETGDYQTIVDEHARLFLPMDQDGSVYDAALEKVGRYITGKIAQAEALEILQDTVETFRDEKEGLEAYTVSEEFGSLLMEYGILPEEFEAFGNSREPQLQSYLTDLESISGYLENADEYAYQYRSVVFWHDLCETLQDSHRGYYYYSGVNYWFAGWKDSQTAYVQEQVIDRLESYIPEGCTWETDREVIEQKTMHYLDLADDCVELAAEFEGQEREELYMMERQFEKLEELEQQYSQIQNMENKLEQMQDITARLGVLSEKIGEAKAAGDEGELQRLEEEFRAIAAEYEELKE